MFWNGALGLLLSVIGVGVASWVTSESTLFNYSATVYWLIFGAAIADTLGVYSMTIAFQSDTSGFVSLISYINVIYAFLADYFIFKENFAWVELLAAVVILVVTVLTSIVKMRESKVTKDDSDSFKNAN